MSTAFISQYIRILYPAILNYDHGIMITDIDMIPMNSTYFTKNIDPFEANKFIYLRAWGLGKINKEIAMCYNVATSKTWSEIFEIFSLDDIYTHLNKIYKSDQFFGWSSDQINLYRYVMNWNQTTNNFIHLTDDSTKYNRLNRIGQGGTLILNDSELIKISSGLYTDYHCSRPYDTYKVINDEIYEALPVP